MLKTYLIEIDDEMGIDYADSGPWRSYHLNALGNTLAECVADARIEELDKDGGTLRCYGLDEASGAAFDSAMRMIRAALAKAEAGHEP